MMKKLLILTAAGMLTISTVGCRCNWWPWRRPYCDPCAPVYSNPCPPACPTDPCDPCATPGAVTPGPQPYGGVSG
jgi:hypothetical protein